jgi:hypothetical protein
MRTLARDDSSSPATAPIEPGEEPDPVGDDDIPA